MARDGYESDKNRLFIYDFETKTKSDFTKDFDQNAESLAWADDSKSIFFISDIQATDEIYRLNILMARSPVLRMAFMIIPVLFLPVTS